MRQRILTLVLVLAVAGLVGGILLIRATTPPDPCASAPMGLECPGVQGRP
jgi:hypothetical protein